MKKTRTVSAETTPHLEFHTPRGPFRHEITSGTVTIGRHPTNSVIVRDERSSRFHCLIELKDGRYILRDLESRNGTKLNGQKITEAELHSGDVIRVGSTRIRFVNPGEEQAAAEPIPLEGSEQDDIYDELAPVEDDDYLLGEGFDDIDDPLTALQAKKKSRHDSLPSYAQQIMDVVDAVPHRERMVEFDELSLIDSTGITRHAANQQKTGKRRGGNGSEAVYVLKLLLFACFRCRATDLHLEPKRSFFNVRIRVDGFLVNLAKLPPAIGNRVEQAVKVLCNLDTSQHRIVQEGHFSTSTNDRRVDYRVSFTPSVNGQNMVIRVLDASIAPSSLNRLGMPRYMYEKVRKISRQDSGLLMVCGPTGSGKTTTLYAVLREIDREQRNVITIEDPVEFQIEGVTQLPVSEERGNTFSTLLRSVLRQDPDVLLVGEIRDLDTAKTAMQASMTGHVVLTTVHARDTIGSIFRLIDLGVEPYLVANALNMVLAQRLIRRLCPHCKKPVKPSPQQTMAMGRFLEGVNEIMVPVGCRRCLSTGFVGRQAIFELLLFTDELRDVVLHQPTIQAMRKVITSGLFTTLQQSAWKLVARGETSYSEAERVAGTVDG